MKFTDFMNLIYDIHLDAARSEKAELKEKLLSVITNVSIVESNYGSIEDLANCLNKERSEQNQNMLLTQPMLLEYNKYKAFKPKLLSLSSIRIHSAFDFKMKYGSSEIKARISLESEKDEEKKKAAIESVTAGCKKITKDLLFQMIRHEIHIRNETMTVDKIKENNFIFKDFFPFFEENQNLFDVIPEIDKKMQEFLLNPIQLEDTEVKRLLNFYDFEYNSYKYENKRSSATTKEEDKKTIDILNKIIDNISVKSLKWSF
jgi:hypothetical protein